MFIDIIILNIILRLFRWQHSVITINASFSLSFPVIQSLSNFNNFIFFTAFDNCAGKQKIKMKKILRNDQIDNTKIWKSQDVTPGWYRPMPWKIRKYLFYGKWMLKVKIVNWKVNKSCNLLQLLSIDRYLIWVGLGGLLITPCHNDALSKFRVKHECWRKAVH